MKILSSIFTSILAKNDTEQANDDTTLLTSTTAPGTSSLDAAKIQIARKHHDSSSQHWGGHCGGADDICIKCFPDKIYGAFKFSTIDPYTMESEIKSEQIAQIMAITEINGGLVGDCQSNYQYNPALDIFTFEILLGDCDMAVSLHEQNNKKYIKFGLNFKIDGEQNQEIYFGDLHEFSYDCNYDAFGSTGPTEYDVEFVQRSGVFRKSIVSYQTWNNLSLDCFTDESFTEIKPKNTLVVGERFYFNINWEMEKSDNFPIKFYTHMCTVRDQVGNSYDIINHGCLSSLVEAKSYGEKHTIDEVRYSYKSFSFDRSKGKIDLKINCQIGFCRLEDILTGECGLEVKDDSCNHGYHLQ